MSATPHYTQLPKQTDRPAASTFALVIGVLLLVEGLWGMTSPVVFGVLTTNLLHAAIHIGLGVAGIAAGVRRRPAGYLLFLGVLLLAVGVLYFLPALHELLIRVLNLNTAVASVNILVGTLALLVRRLP